MTRSLRWHIDEMMDHFDFNKAQQAMSALEWQWVGVDGVPELHHLRKKVRELMTRAFEMAHRSTEPYYSIATCGFLVEYDVIDDNFHVSFYVTDWNSNPYGAEV
jgi:hypothetical protein